MDNEENMEDNNVYTKFDKSITILCMRKIWRTIAFMKSLRMGDSF